MHEAQHALDARVPAGRWNNETIDRHVKRLGTTQAIRSEIMCRAVEQVVCLRLGVETKPVEKWALTSCMEAIKFRDPFPDYEQTLAAIRRTLASESVQKNADAIIALAHARVDL